MGPRVFMSGPMGPRVEMGGGPMVSRVAMGGGRVGPRGGHARLSPWVLRLQPHCGATWSDQAAGAAEGVRVCAHARACTCVCTVLAHACVRVCACARVRVCACARVR
eukprot:2528311-Prymnesium_polylepis.1